MRLGLLRLITKKGTKQAPMQKPI